MSFDAPRDPFRNETELLKQIALFQRKAQALDNCHTPHQRDMRALYLRIVAQCRSDLAMLGQPAASPGRLFEGA